MSAPWNSRILLIVPVLVLMTETKVLAQSGRVSADPVIESTVNPIFPRQLMENGINSGMVQLLVEVNADGKMVDALAIEASHPVLAETTLNALNNWKFLPKVVDGKNYGYVKPIKIDFDMGKTVVNLTTIGFATSISRGPGMSTSSMYGAVRLKDLDAIPRPVSMTGPVYPEEWQKMGVEGTVNVEFYIDDKGKVRVPYVTEGTGTQLDIIALETVKTWRFESPLSKGKPTLVKAAQKFSFKVGADGIAEN